MPLHPPMAEAAAVPPSAAMRPLGRGRRHRAADLAGRFANWHAARANRWERLGVEQGTLVLEWLEDAGTSTREVRAGEMLWLAPGRRWRIARCSDDAIFSLQVHADDSVIADAPQAGRAALLDEAAPAQPEDSAALASGIAALAAGERRLLRTRFDPAPTVRAALAASDGTLSWHPLAGDEGDHAALLVRTAGAVDLLDYLGRDHALIEATLVGALRGDAVRERWLRGLLQRHLAIEEEDIFPAFLAAGGSPETVAALRREHDLLRGHLANIADPASHRGLLLVLEAHDEKEEQLVYPDFLARIGARADAVTAAIIAKGSAR